jgi:hypothetical protein
VNPGQLIDGQRDRVISTPAIESIEREKERYGGGEGRINTENWVDPLALKLFIKLPRLGRKGGGVGAK